MNPKAILFSVFVFVLIGCAAQERVITPLPPFPEGVSGARWGASIDAVKESVGADGQRWFQEDTGKPPYAGYASGTYLNAPAIFSYFFTPKSKRLFRVDVTFSDPKIYEAARASLIQRFKTPTFSQTDKDLWTWEDNSLIIFQRDSKTVQISYSTGPFLKLNYQEGAG